jgi:hypothetical protein
MRFLDKRDRNEKVSNSLVYILYRRLSIRFAGTRKIFAIEEWCL